MRRAILAAALTLLTAAGLARAEPDLSGPFEFGLIPSPRMLLPKGPAAALVFLFSDGRWTPADDAAAARIQAAGAAVMGVDTAAYLHAIDAATGECAYLVADFEALGHEVQRATGATTFRAPIVAGAGLGGALAVDVLAQTPEDTLGAAVAVDPAAGLPLTRPLCTGAARLSGPAGVFYAARPGDQAAPLTVVLTAGARRGARDRVKALTDEGARFTLRRTGAAPGDAIETAVAAVINGMAAGDAPAEVVLDAEPTHDAMAVVLSGDGGWRDLDRQIAGVLQGEGVPVVGLDSLRWFWRPRTPEETGAELSRLVSDYAARWGVRRVALIGYSFGADVIPEAWAAMTPAAQGLVTQISLLGLAAEADWEITVSGWLGGASSDARPTGPALRRLPMERVQCVYGDAETDSACPPLGPAGAELIRTKGGHHFDGDYPALARRILDGLDRRGRAATNGPPAR